MNRSLTRRSFLKKSSLVVAATTLSGNFTLFNASPTQAAATDSFRPHAFVEISQDNIVTVWLGQTNLGQGTHTGIAMVIAEELDADWKTIQTKMALAAEPFKDPHWHMQLTGGSTSIRHRWDMLRQAGAASRQMLVEAAAREWNVPAEKCTTQAGKVIHPDGQSRTYGELVPKANKLPVPENPPLKEAREYTIIGSEKKRLDIPDKVAGKTIYGIDVQLPNMCIAVIARPPRFGARPISFDEKAATALPGVLKVAVLDDKVAVCGTTTYAAILGREKLNIKWTPGTHPSLSDNTLERHYLDDLDNKPGKVAETKGVWEEGLKMSSHSIAINYTFPYLAHGALEPINCTAHVEKDRCRIWVPTQGQTSAQMTGAKITKLPMESVEVITTYVGGGFGLRGEVDPVVDAVTLSQIMARPVKVLWTREDDFANDYFRPASVHKVSGGIDAKGNLTFWNHKIAAPSIMTRLMPDYVKNGIDPTAVQGVPDMVYEIPNRLVEYVMTDLPIPVGFWRSVGYSYTTYVVETMIDELAHAAQQDPVAFRLQAMKKGTRPHDALSLLAQKTGWNGSSPKGKYIGFAVTECFGSAVAQMAEVSVEPGSGNVKVNRMVCAVDCGPAVYPDAITAQMEGAIVMALSVAFKEKISFENGGVTTLNYDDYPLLTMSEVPDVEVHIAQSRHPIGGIGEPGIPAVAPAVANAIFQATGVRLRDLPFNTSQLKGKSA